MKDLMNKLAELADVADARGDLEAAAEIDGALRLLSLRSAQVPGPDQPGGGHALRIIENTTSAPTEQEEDEGNWYDEGETSNDYTESVEPDEYDLEDGLTAVDLAVRKLQDIGATMPSDSSGAPRWFDTPDSHMDMHTGESTTTSVHLIGFTPEEAMEIASKMGGRFASASKQRKSPTAGRSKKNKWYRG